MGFWLDYHEFSVAPEGSEGIRDRSDGCGVGASFHPRQLRLHEGMVDTTNMVRSILQIACIGLFVLFCFPSSSTGQGPKKPGILKNLTTQPYFVHFARLPSQTAPSNDLRSLLDRQARWDDAALRNSEGSGLRLRFEKIDEQATQGGRIATRYRVYAEGAPQDKVFSFQTWLIDDTFSVDPRDIYVNGQGLLMTRKPKPEEEMVLKAEDDELHIVSVTQDAEPLRFQLTRRDGQEMIFGSLVAHPVVSFDQGCVLEVKIAQPGATTVLIDADGFPAKAKIPLVLKSEGEDVSDILDTNQDGHAVMAVMTAIPGKTQGMLKASAEGRNCLPSVVLPWSAGANAPEKTVRH
ncbi:MAG: hypothetical protein ABSD44_07085 [Terracidiphilus sp.]